MRCLRFFSISALLAASIGEAKPPLNLDLRVEHALEIQPCPAGEGQPAPSTPLTTSLPCVETTLGLEHLFAPHTLRFLYYDPDGNLYAATKADWTLKPEAGTTGYHPKALVRHRLNIAGEEAALKPGSWKVAAWLDGLTVSEAVFRLQRSIPSDERLENVGRIYRELRFEDIEPLAELALAKEQSPALRAEYLAWEALACQALGKEPQAQAALEKLLQEDPFFAWSPPQIEELGAKDAARHLEILRGRLRPEIYRKHLAPLSAELSPQEPPPAYSKRHWYRQWYFYAGTAALVIPATILLRGGGETVQETGAPSLGLEFNPTLFDSTLCDNQISVHSTLEGGFPPYDLLLTAAVAGRQSKVKVEGLAKLLDTESVVIFKVSGLQSSATRPLPKLDVQDPKNSRIPALLRFTAYTKDSRSASSFDAIDPGSRISSATLEAWRQDTHLASQTVEQIVRSCDGN